MPGFHRVYITGIERPSLVPFDDGNAAIFLSFFFFSTPPFRYTRSCSLVCPLRLWVAGTASDFQFIASGAQIIITTGDRGSGLEAMGDRIHTAREQRSGESSRACDSNCFPISVVVFIAPTALNTVVCRQTDPLSRAKSMSRPKRYARPVARPFKRSFPGRTTRNEKSARLTGRRRSGKKRTPKKPTSYA